MPYSINLTIKAQTRRWMLMASVPALWPQGLQAAEVSVAVASNFMAPMKLIAQRFESETGYKVKLAFGATGQFYAQIRHGAPFSILLSADEHTPLKLESEGLAVAGSRLTYAMGRLVLWSNRPGLVDAQGEILRSGRFDKLALANPKAAPYGLAALQTLDKLRLRDSLAPKLVEGANVTQAFQFVASENAPLGFVALAQVFENGQIKTGSGWVVPAAMHAPIKQDALLLNPGRNQAAAKALLQYLRSDAARSVIKNFGYGLPP